jgi:hypothetical protein
MTNLKLSTGGVPTKAFVKNIEDIAVKSEGFRQVLYTEKNCQRVVMALKPKEKIGMEVHKLDQFCRVEARTGEAVLDGVRTVIGAGFAVPMPAGRITTSSILALSICRSIHSIRRRIIVTLLSTIRAPKQKRTTNTSTVKRQNSYLSFGDR